MGLYVTISNEGANFPDLNVTPFCTALDITMAGGTTAGACQIELQEMPGRFAAEFDDLSQYLQKGYHLRIWHSENDIIYFRYFGGLIETWTRTIHADDAKTTRRYRVFGVDYSTAALDDSAIGTHWINAATPALPVKTIPGTDIGSQCAAALGAFNAGARLHISSIGIRELGNTLLPAVPIRNMTLRQTLRTILANAVAADPGLKPRFYIDVSRLVRSDFEAAVFYLYNAADAGDPEEAFSCVPLTGAHTTNGPIEETFRGTPPFTTRALVQNVGGYYQEATAGRFAGWPNPLNAAGTWDKVVTQAANADKDLLLEATRIAEQDSNIRKEYTWSSYGRARPGQWVTLACSHLGGDESRLVVITGAAVHWDQKTQSTVIDGEVNTQPVMINYRGSDRLPELNEDVTNGPDLGLVMARRVANAGRNLLQGTQAGGLAGSYETLTVRSDLDPRDPLATVYDRSWYLHGIHHPIGARMMFATDTTKFIVAEDDYEAMDVDLTETSGAGGEVITFTVGGSPASPPFSGSKGDRIGVAVTGTDSGTPLALLVREQDRPFTPTLLVPE